MNSSPHAGLRGLLIKGKPLVHMRTCTSITLYSFSRLNRVKLQVNLPERHTHLSRVRVVLKSKSKVDVTDSRLTQVAVCVSHPIPPLVPTNSPASQDHGDAGHPVRTGRQIFIFLARGFSYRPHAPFEYALSNGFCRKQECIALGYTNSLGPASCTPQNLVIVL